MIYEVTLTQRYFDQLVINRWNYLSTGAAGASPGAFALCSAMGLLLAPSDFPADTIGAKIHNMQSESVTFVSVLAKAIREAPTDFYDYAYPGGVVGGVTSAQGMSPVAAWGFRTSRTRTDIARGTKRLVGIAENMSDAGGKLNGTAVSIAADLAAAMSADLSYTTGGASLTFSPIVVQKEMYTEPPAKKAYRYYATLAAQLDHIAEGIVWSEYDTVRSQTSRQYGHGA